MNNGSADAITAGSFGDWLRELRDALDGRGEMDVPCGDCTACCRAAYFIQVKADETHALDAIPQPLLFPAPGDQSGTQVMGFDEHGHCPMLVSSNCSIYDARPRTCRVFDCRVFAATGIYPEETAKAQVNARARQWRFTFNDGESRNEAAAVEAAGSFLRDHSAALQDVLPRSTTQMAVLAIRLHRLFLNRATEDTEQLIQQIRQRITAEHP